MRPLLLALALLSAVPAPAPDAPPSEQPGPKCYPIIGCIKA